MRSSIGRYRVVEQRDDRVGGSDGGDNDDVVVVVMGDIGGSREVKIGIKRKSISIGVNRSKPPSVI